MDPAPMTADPFTHIVFLLNSGALAQALPLTEALLQTEKSARVYRALGFIHKTQGNLEKAVEYLENAVEVDEADHNSLSLLAEIYLSVNDLPQAIGHYVLAIDASPDTLSYKENFLILAGGVTFEEYNQVIADALSRCLQTPELECQGAQILWYNLLIQHPEIKKIYKGGADKGLPCFISASLEKAKSLSFLQTPLFVAGLQKLVIYNPIFEQFITALRRKLLDAHIQKSSLMPEADLVNLAAAIGIYAYSTEYIFDTSKDEQNWVTETLAQAEALSPVALALLSCYHPLSNLPMAQDLQQQHNFDPALSALFQTQIAEPQRLADLRGTIKQLTPIDDATSEAVRAQYEEFPYPRWKNLTPATIHPETEGFLQEGAPDILIAGCGTGREALQLAAALPHAKITAVDLSLTSLSYAIDRARLHGLDKNITFAQADILKLGDMGMQFDFIASAGVLHHMQDPTAGWRVLASLLKPHGVMRLGLYSSLARYAVTTARKAIRDHKIGSTAAAMKDFRKHSTQALSPQVIADLMGYGDYYHLSMYRDLIFHVQEHQFDIPGIGITLKNLGLQFRGFILSEAQAQAFENSFRPPVDFMSLKNWAAFEAQNPHAFREMYHFWCSR